MNKEILYEILNSKSETLSSTEIENIMNEELDKSTQDMDTDLIDLCLEALNAVDKEKQNKSKKKYRIGKILIAAIVFIFIIGISIPVCAKYFNINVPEGIVAIYEDCFNINILQDEYVKDINGQLELDGIENVVLPQLAFYPETKFFDYSCRNDNGILDIEFSFSSDEYNGYVTIVNSSTIAALQNKKVNSNYEDAEYFEVNGVPVLVFSNENLSFINYIANDYEYNITLECDFNTACQIAKSL